MNVTLEADHQPNVQSNPFRGPDLGIGEATGNMACGVIYKKITEKNKTYYLEANVFLEGTLIVRPLTFNSNHFYGSLQGCEEVNSKEPLKIFDVVQKKRSSTAKFW